ncbi:MAG: hypothetical protein ACJA2S_000901 [Cyclobacteriaceae bacterium]|jgi:hypothetical protein
MDLNSEDINIEFNYSFQTGLGVENIMRCIQKVDVAVMASNINFPEKPLYQIGELSFFIIHLDEAINLGLSFYEVIESYDQYVFESCSKVIDLEKDEFYDSIKEHYDGGIIGSTFCLFGSLAINPSYRGNLLGAKLIKDVIFHYSSACSLFVLKPFPLQFEGRADEKPKEDHQFLGLEQNEVKAKQKLIHYYSKLDFETIEGIEDLMFLDSSLKNNALERIDLEEFPVIKLKNP